MVDGCFMVDGPCVNHPEKAVNHVLWLTVFLGRWLTEPCSISIFELSGHQFGTIMKSFILTFQSASIQPSPVKYCLSRMQETLFQAAKTPGMCFFWKKSPRQGCTTQKSGLGMQQQIVYHNPNIQISNLEVPVGMVDGILANPRNPVNHDLWLTGRFSTSRQPSLFLSLRIV